MLSQERLNSAKMAWVWVVTFGFLRYLLPAGGLSYKAMTADSEMSGRALRVLEAITPLG